MSSEEIQIFLLLDLGLLPEEIEEALRLGYYASIKK